MTRQAVARRYANALYDVVSRQNRVPAVERELSDLAALLASHDELRRTFESSAIPAARKRAILDALVERVGAPSAETGRLLALLAERDRLSFIVEIAQAFRARVRHADRVLEAELVSAVPLAPSHKAALAGVLSKATASTVTVTERVDPSIIGGVIANVGNLVFDGSVQSQIERFRQRLRRDA